ncbi:flagellar biosynthesis protein FlhB [Geobacter argillaceus]|uniref:Flagellar biosynthetic protein FlhB n=1 Tax=Geobacter argillaceus TaxID=345631 RepID=A0A562VJA0_9BACT|nr:flagellar biosynthesis protein FlhB [Geobacter argillaceus]TWJ18046.1 flagellar biosynthetic protein FlhB [Geobacter argillaceus]
MAEQDKHSRTEKPTGKRISQAKNKGNLPRSRELTSTATLLAAIVTLYVISGFILATLKGGTHDILANLRVQDVTPAGVYSLMLKCMLMMGAVLAPYMVVILIATFLVTIVQEPFSISWERMSLSLDKLNPVSGMKRLFNKDAAVEALKSVLKLFIVGWMAYRVLRDEVVNLVYIVDSDILGILTYVSHISFKIVLHSCGVLLVLSIFDLAWVKWRFIENLKMTKQEVKQESKDTEGDPRVKAKIKQLRYAQARRRMRKIVPTADVVITNPTHYAVALKYERNSMAAPVVLVKAVDYMAQQMKEIAREHKVMLVENRFLARELYAQVEEGREIPESLYAAVAEVLAYVFSLKGKI